MPSIKPFKLEDLGYFLPNTFSNPDRLLAELCDPDYEVECLWDEGMVQAIMMYTNYWGDCWRGGFLIAENFNPRLASVIRDHVHATMEKKNASRLHTESVACIELHRWHKFLGFKWEGCREGYLFGLDYDMWAKLREVK